MIIEVRIPTPGESISEVDLASWLVADGDYVNKDQEIAEVESDKATLPLIAEKSGTVRILVTQGETIKVGTVACTIDTSAIEPASAKEKPVTTSGEAARKSAEVSAPVDSVNEKSGITAKQKLTPLARKMMEGEGIKLSDMGTGVDKITTREVKRFLERKSGSPSTNRKGEGRPVHREAMSQLRKKLAKRLVAVKNETAMLTTFNEVDMSTVMSMRKQYQEKFVEKHGVKLGFMSFFIKAVTLALQEYPRVNSMIDGDEILLPDYVDVSIAVQTDKGLMVPVLRNTERMSLADMEKKILELADKARRFRLSIEEMTGGNFSITNGGVFGSMLSTPIINPPQSGILGMHNIVERPVAINGEVTIRPIMYVALSYDHRVIDGRDSVSFLVKVKELIEAPEKMIPEGSDPEKQLLEL